MPNTREEVVPNVNANTQAVAPIKQFERRSSLWACVHFHLLATNCKKAYVMELVECCESTITKNCQCVASGLINVINYEYDYLSLALHHFVYAQHTTL